MRQISMHVSASGVFGGMHHITSEALHFMEALMKMVRGAECISRSAVRATGVALTVFLGFSWSNAASAANQAAPPEEVRATVVSADGAFSAKDDPAAALWARVPEQTVELTLAPPVHQAIALLHSASGQVSAPPLLGVSVITDRQRIYFRLRWRDQTKDDQRKIGAYSDGAAIEVPLTEGDTSQMMGLPEKPVAIWRWSATGNAVEALLAGSPGTLTKWKSDTLRGKGAYRSVSDAGSSEWSVVISQDLDASGDGWTQLRTRRSFPVAFAVWQGSDYQRGGYKLVSNWISVGLEGVR